MLLDLLPLPFIASYWLNNASTITLVTSAVKHTRTKSKYAEKAVHRRRVSKSFTRHSKFAVCTNTTNVWSGENYPTKRERE